MITHSIAPLSGTRKFSAIAGRLMLTIDESSVAMNTPIATSAKTVHLFVVSSAFGSMPSYDAQIGRGPRGNRRHRQTLRTLPRWLFEDQKEQVAVRICLETLFFADEMEVVPNSICVNQFLGYLVVLCGAAARPIGLSLVVNHRQNAAGLERAGHRAEHRVVILHFMVRQHDYNRVQRSRRKFWIVLSAENGFDL